MLITIASYQIPNWRYGGQTAKLRVFADRNYLSPKSRLVMKGSIASKTWFKEVDCTISGNTLIIPEFTLPSTTDSDQPLAAVEAIFYDAKGIKRDYIFSDFKKLKIPHELGSTATWNQIRVFQRLRTTAAKSYYPTLNEMVSLVDEYVGTISEQINAETGFLTIDGEATYLDAIAAASASSTVVGAYMKADVLPTSLIEQPENLIITPLNGACFDGSLGGGVNFLGNGFDRATLLGNVPVFKNFDALDFLWFSGTKRAVESINLTDNTIRIRDHNFQDYLGIYFFIGAGGTAITYSLSGTQNLPVFETKVYARNVTKDTFQISLTPEGAILDLNGTGTGARYFHHEFTSSAVQYNSLKVGTHDWAQGESFEYFTSGSPIDNMTSGEDYFVKAPGNDYFAVAATLGGASLAMTGDGSRGAYHCFIKNRRIKFIGATFPAEISSELFSTGDESPQNRLTLTSVALLGKATVIKPIGRTFNSDTAWIFEGHKVDFGNYEFPNNFAAHDNKAPIHFFKDSSFYNGILHESLDSSSALIIQAADGNGDTGFVEYRDLRFKNPGDFYNDASTANVSVGNCMKGYKVSDCIWEKTHGYSIHIGNYRINGFYAAPGSVERLKFLGCRQQPFFIQNTEGCSGSDIYFKNTSADANAPVFVDFESNEGRFDLVSNIVFGQVRIETDGVTTCYGLFGLNAARTRRIKNVTLQDSELISNNLTVAAIGGHGIDGFKLKNVVMRGAKEFAVSLMNCVNTEIENLRVGEIGEQTENYRKYFLRLTGCKRTKVNGVYVDNLDPTATWNNKILEDEFGIFSSGTANGRINLTELGGERDFRGFRTSIVETLWKDSAVTYNAKDWAVRAVSPQNYNGVPRYLEVIGTLPDLSIPVGTMDFSTNYFTTDDAHGLAPGACLALVNETFLTNGAETPLPAHTNHPQQDWVDTSFNGFYYAIPHPSDPNQVALAHYLDEALAETAINFTTNGTGRCALIPVVQTKFSSSTFRNLEVEAITTAGTSQVDPPSAPAYGTPIKINVGGAGVDGWQDNTFLVEGLAATTDVVAPIVAGVDGAAPAEIYQSGAYTNPGIGVKHLITGLPVYQIYDAVLHTVTQFTSPEDNLVVAGVALANSINRYNKAGAVLGKAVVYKGRVCANGVGEISTLSLGQAGVAPILCGIELYPVL